MTPKEKADELMNRYIDASVVIEYGTEHYHEYPYTLAKQCAFIAVDEMLSHTMNCDYGCAGHSYEFWIEVRNEIEKL